VIPPGYRAFAGGTFVPAEPGRPLAGHPFRLPDRLVPDVAGPAPYLATVRAAEAVWGTEAVHRVRSACLLPDGRLQVNHGIRLGDVAYAWWGVVDGKATFGCAYAKQQSRTTGARQALSATTFKQLAAGKVSLWLP
jgi:hypothetical protein